ncbi:MAG: YfiR family protein [Steroidobacteraceae bacterium]
MTGRLRPVRRLLWAVTALASLSVAGAAVAAPVAPTEYQVKAVFLYNFSRFVAWPPGAFTAPNEPFVIGILGSDPFGNRLDEAVRGEQIGQHPLVVRRFRDVTQIGDCRILFIDRSEDAQLGQILASLNHHSVLTVSDLDDASERGIMIELATQDSRVRLRVNVASARAAGLTISANLLRLAQIVRTGDAD